MATSNYTPNLHLSAWADSDRPKRADFVSDNSIIDSVLGGHISDSNIHMTAEEKAKATAPFVIAGYAGSGESTRVINLDFRPSMVLLYKRGTPFVSYNGSVMTVNSACAVYGHGASSGLSITSSGVQVTQDTSAINNIKASLNEHGMQYTLIAFK